MRSSAEREASPACAATLGSLAANPASAARHDSDVGGTPSGGHAGSAFGRHRRSHAPAFGKVTRGASAAENDTAPFLDPKSTW